MNEMMYLIRRELWENRSIYFVPVIFAAIMLLSFAVAIVRGTIYVGDAHIAEQIGRLSPGMAGEAVSVISFGLWFCFSGIVSIIIFFYALDALYGDRKDRSVLFWKSLPITDTQTVLSKLLIALVVAPAIAVAVALATALLFVVVLSVAMIFQGYNPFPLLWGELPLFSIAANMLTIELAVSIWFLPFVAWFLFASAASTRTPFLIALLVPAGIAFAEKLAFNTSVFLDTLGDYADRFYEPLFRRMENLRIEDGSQNFDVSGALPGPADVMSILLDPALLVGLLVGITLIVLTIQLRHRRIDIG